MHKTDWAQKKLCTIFQWGISLFSHWWFLREPRIIPPWDLHVPFTCIIGSPAILFLAIMLHNVYIIIHLSLHKWCQEKNTCTGKTAKIESQNTFCASEWSERAIFGVFNSFTVKKVSIFTINVKFKVILSSNSGGDVCTGHPPHPKKWGEYIPPIPPGIYASACIHAYIHTICIFLVWYHSDNYSRYFFSLHKITHSWLCHCICSSRC